MTYYRYQMFFCINQKAEAKACCANHQAQAMRDYAKSKLKKLGLHHVGACRANTTSCLGRCDEGPILVIYPEGVWYSYKTHHDIDLIIEQHIIHGQPVEQLLLSSLPPEGFV